MKKQIIIYANILMLFCAIPSMYAQQSIIGYSDLFMFATESYNLTLNADPEEGGTAEGEGEFFYGEKVEISAHTEEGWEFVEWTGDIEHVDDPESATATVTMPAADVTLTANFDPPLFTLTLNAEPEEGGTVEGAGEYPEGEEVTITASPAENFEFDYWSGDTEHVDDVGSATTNVTMPAEDITLTVVFFDVSVEEIPVVDVKVFPNPANNEFIVESSEMINQIRLISINGQVIKDIGVDAMSTEISVHNLRTGIYFMQIHSANSVITERVQIIR